MDKKTLSENLQRIMNHAGVRPCDLAASLGMSRGYISMILNAKLMPAANRLAMIANHLGVTTEDLLKPTSRCTG